jgi:hypothetical protein
LDQEAGENLEQASGVVSQNLDDAFRARIAERSWPVLRAGVFFTVIGLVLLMVICAAIWKVHAPVSSFLRERESLFPGKLPLFGFNLPNVATWPLRNERTAATLVERLSSRFHRHRRKAVPLVFLQFFACEIDPSGESSGQPSFVGCQDLSGLYNSIPLKIFSVSGPKSFWYTTP